MKKLEITVLKKVEVKTLQVKANVRHWEDATIDGVSDENGDLTPCRINKSWTPLIELETGKILNWTKGVKADIHFKVCDDGSYYLLNEEGQIIVSVEDEYVPSMLSPKGEGYGDYIIMDIDEDGLIQDWEVNLEEFDSVAE